MNLDPGRRLATALDQMQGLDPAGIELYLRALRQSDPEVADRLRVILNLPDSSSDRGTGPADRTPVPSDEVRLGEPGPAVDARATTSFPQSRSVSADIAPPAGVVPGRYQMLQAVGRGAFGEVWKAFDTVLNKPVAVKVARTDRDTPAALFLEEARKAASLTRHPAIVQVHDAVETDDGWFIVSEFIDGTSLRERIAEGPVPLDQAARIAAAVAGALHTAHLAGLVHRDVKPGNILLDRAGAAYLTDFGLAVREEDQFAERSRVSGTLAYMPPEQISGDTHLLDGRADIYALGAVLYELLTGRLVFRAADYDEYRELILRREPRPPRAIKPAVPAELERICLKCLAKEVRDRYRTAADVAADLDNWLVGSTDSYRYPAPVPAARGWGKWAAAGVVLALAAGTAVVLLTRDREKAVQAPPVDPPAGGLPAAQPVVAQAPPEKARQVKELLWANVNDRNEWKVLPNGKELMVRTSRLSLLRLGDSPGDNWTFSATVSQLHPTGGVGLFLGHHKDVRGKWVFEVIWLVKAGDEIHIQRATREYPSDVARVEPEGVVYAGGPVKNWLHENTIRLIVRGGVLSEVHFNGQPVPKLWDGPDPRPPAIGAFGVYNRNSESTFSNPKLNDVPIPLRVE